MQEKNEARQTGLQDFQNQGSGDAEFWVANQQLGRRCGKRQSCEIKSDIPVPLAGQGDLELENLQVRKGRTTLGKIRRGGRADSCA